MEIRYRFVDYGTNFIPFDGKRAPAAELSANQLANNELVVDVGGVCWGYAGESRRVLDHHFLREAGQYPSAAAAVLHNAARIHDDLAKKPIVWLVSHIQPDFDAFCALYLAAGVLREQVPAAGWEKYGIHPDGWLPFESERGSWQIDWFNPRVGVGVDSRFRCPILLAACAACVDNGRPMACPRHRRLHSVLYAAIRRGRDYQRAPTAADEFFAAVRSALNAPTGCLNPLFDTLLERPHELFDAELALLDREPAAYERDIRRARRTTVLVPRSDPPFQEWFKEVKRAPLLTSSAQLNSEHLMKDAVREQVDGVFLRDPECLLFKEWAREDRENSSMGRGFVFTAVAYSSGLSGALRNDTRYIFALDPEYAGSRGIHLYPLWARLQAGEVKAFHDIENDELRRELNQRDLERMHNPVHGRTTICREHFEGRAGDFKALFNDPWFDGQNYEATIIDTPNRGSLVRSRGFASNLTDDPLGRLVQDELESVLFKVPCVVEDVPSGRKEPAGIAPASDPHRFVHAILKKDVDILRGMVPEQVGTELWRKLVGQTGVNPPLGFVERHLLRDENWLGVSNARGVAFACREGHEGLRDSFRVRFRDAVSLAAEVEWFARRIPSPAELPAFLISGDELMRRVVQLNHDLTLPQYAVLQRFVSASRLDELLKSLHDIHSAAAGRLQDSNWGQIADIVEQNVTTVASVQRKLEWIEVFVVSVYFAHLYHMITEKLLPEVCVSSGTLGVAFVSAVTALLILRPWKHRVIHPRGEDR